MELTAPQARVVACLIEKAATTPDSYPLTTNALVAACNQSTNRDPVVSYSARDVDAAMLELRQLGLARAVTGGGHRSSKHKHIVGDALDLDGAQVAVLGVLTLRGPQTLNEVVTRTERYVDGPGGDTSVVDSAIDALCNREDPLARRLERRPGEREPRIEQLWVSSVQSNSTQLAATPETDVPPDDPGAPLRSIDRSADLTDRVAALEASLARQTARLDSLLQELGIDTAAEE